jgi:hypothetical protein
MLVRHPRKLVRPGQWVLAKLQDLLKKNSPNFEHTDSVFICIVPEYGPIHDSESGFRWWYYINWRRQVTPIEGEPRYKWYWSHHTQYRVWNREYSTDVIDRTKSTYSYLIQYDFDLIEYGYDHRCAAWDENEGRLRNNGQGGYLYTPASDDPEVCPGADYSLYQCSDCEKWVLPHSDDQGDLACPNCGPSLVGLVHGEKTAEQIERARDLADHVDLVRLSLNKPAECRRFFESRLNMLARTQGWGLPSRCGLSTEDKFSFYFCFEYHKDGKWLRDMNGGLILHGPHAEPLAEGGYRFTTWDYTEKRNRSATREEISEMCWSTHT